MKSFICLFAALTGNVALACPNGLGTWQSSRELSVAYNINAAKLTPVQIELQNKILGILKVTITQTEVLSHGAPSVEVTVNGKSSPFVFEEARFKYEILSCTSDTITTKEYVPWGDPVIGTAHFVDENTYWVGFPSSQSREYFVRVNESL